MTEQEHTFKRDLTFSQWIRNKLPDSATGFLVSDLDFILYNFKTKRIMFLEVKTRGKQLKTWQHILFQKMISKWVSVGIKYADPSWTYLGFKYLIFENTSFDDGICTLDGIVKTEEELRQILSL